MEHLVIPTKSIVTARQQIFQYDGTSRRAGLIPTLVVITIIGMAWMVMFLR